MLKTSKIDWVDILDLAKSNITDIYNIWEEEPVDFKTFVESPLYSNGPSLSKYAYKEIEKAIGSNPKDFFTEKRKIRELVLLVGKGGGKGLVSVYLEEWVFYLLLCLKNPHKYFGVAEEDPLSLVNVAVAGRQSGDLFERFKNRIKTNYWFRSSFQMYERGKRIKAGTGNKGTIDITGETINFPKNLKAISLNSHQEAWEGKNVIFWIADEISGFVSEKKQLNADKIYSALITSSRELPSFGIISSYPRNDEEHDFCYLKYLDSKKSEFKEFMHGVRASTWEFKPAHCFSGKTFDFLVDKSTGRIEKVPFEYSHQFIMNPEDSKAKYMTIISSMAGDYFEYMDWGTIQYIAPKILAESEFSQAMDNIYVAKKIVSCVRDNIPRVITIDSGEVECDTALVVSHKEIIDNKEKLVIDGILLWVPDREKNISVNLNNVIDMVTGLGNYFPIRVVEFDHWNSGTMAQTLVQKGIRSVRRNISDIEYDMMKSLMYTGQLVLPDQGESKKFITQCKNLKKGRATKPKVQFGKQDIADAVAHASGIMFGEGSISTALASGLALGSMGSSGDMRDSMNIQSIEDFFHLRASQQSSIIKTAEKKKESRGSILPAGVLIGGRSIQERIKKYLK